MASKYKKRADGRYLIQVLTGYSVEGKPKYKNVYAYTIKELEEKAARVRDELEKGISVNDERLTIEKWAERWLELYKPNVEYNTKKMYQTTLSNHIYPNIGMIRLKELKPHHVQEIINKLQVEGKDRTAELVCMTMTQILSQAVKNEYIYKNIMDSIEINKREKGDKRALTDDEMFFIRNADLPLKEKTFTILLLTTGLRRGEALALLKNDIDMKNRLLKVNKNAIIKSNKMEIKNSPKTQSGNREIPITDELFAYLDKYLPTLQGIYVFPTAKNEFMTLSAFRRMWQKILNAINISAGGTIGKLRIDVIANDITPHTFRHTYATLLYKSGVDVKVAQYLLGHSSLQVTMDIYTHLDSEKKTTEIGKFNTYMNRLIQSNISQSESQ